MDTGIHHLFSGTRESNSSMTIQDPQNQQEIPLNLELAGHSIIRHETDEMEFLAIDKQIKEEVMNRYWYRFAISASTSDTPLNEIIRRSTFMLMSSLTCGAALLWGGMYIYLEEGSAAMYPFTYSVLMTTCFIAMARERRYHDIVFVQLLLILLIPFCLQLQFGGLVKSGGVIVWSFLCPLGAALFCRFDTAKLWLVIYLFCLFLTMCIEGNFLAKSELSGLEVVLFSMNLTGTMVITFLGALTFSVRLDSEYKRSEKLLQNIFPRSIAKRLKDGESNIIDNFENVTILFADLVGFTTAASHFDINLLIGNFLSDVFSSWDKLCDSRSIEKIKTIGDAFMAVGGIDDTGRTATEITTEMILLGLEMQKGLDAINKKYNMSFKVRIGLHSGPVIAGVIGSRKCGFDVWGDAVNTASRMESHGLPGCIHLSSHSYSYVEQQLSHFDFQCRGEIYVKGKGFMITYLLEMASVLAKNKEQGLLSSDSKVSINSLGSSICSQ